jgi:hypothetical protein
MQSTIQLVFERANVENTVSYITSDVRRDGELSTLSGAKIQQQLIERLYTLFSEFTNTHFITYTSFDVLIHYPFDGVACVYKPGDRPVDEAYEKTFTLIHPSSIRVVTAWLYVCL